MEPKTGGRPACHGARALGAAALLALLLAPRAAAPAPATPAPERREYTALPVLGFDSDLGLQLGVFGTLTSFAPGYAPFRFRLELLLSATVKLEAATASLPFHDDHLQLDLPGLLGDRLRLQVILSWGRYSNSPWYGVGNGSSGEVPAAIAAAGELAALRWFRYERTYPRLDVTARWLLLRRRDGALPFRLDLVAGTTVTWNQFRIDAQSELGRELALSRGSGPDAAAFADLLRGSTEHVLPQLRLGLLVEARDHEFVPTRGLRGEVGVRVAPAPDPLRHAGLWAALTGLLPVVPGHVVLAANASADVIVGDPPFYELSGIGGDSSVRGVPGGRFAGRIKLLSHLELRGFFPRFTIARQRFRLGLALLADAGRVWADFRPVRLEGRDADASTRRLATGLGGGLRLAWGEALLVRLDAAWSPSEDTWGLYITTDEAF